MNQVKTLGVRGLGVLVTLGLVGLAGTASGQAWLPGGGLPDRGEGVPTVPVAAVQVAPEEPRTFGTQDEIALVIRAEEFVPEFSTAPWYMAIDLDAATGFLTRGLVSAALTQTTLWFGAVHLPSGAEVTRLEVTGCDFHPTEDLSFALRRITEPGLTGVQIVAIGNTGYPETPGCGRFSTPVPAFVRPLIVDNVNNAYVVVLRTVKASPTTVGTFFGTVRVYYRLRVSPAPATATFGDVPTTHPFFPFIEALVASGITAGCSTAPPRYCPDDPLTRGQMAVFLGRALGLHFTP